MNRTWCGAAGAAALVGLAALFSTSAALEEKEPSIKAIMTRAHKGGNSLIQKVAKDLKAASPDWADVEQKSKELVKLGTSLGKNTPPKGERASWEKLTKQYVINAKALEAAAEKKNKEDALVAHKKLTMMCAACHRLHRPPPPKKN